MMGFREKMAWTTLGSMSAVYGLYFWSVVGSRGGFRFGGLLGTIVVLIALQVIVAIALAIATPKEANARRDERDQLIGLRAARVAYAGLAGGVALACFLAAFSPPIVINMNVLLFILVTAEILRCSWQIIQYRRGTL